MKNSLLATCFSCSILTAFLFSSKEKFAQITFLIMIWILRKIKNKKTNLKKNTKNVL